MLLAMPSGIRRHSGTGRWRGTFAAKSPPVWPFQGLASWRRTLEAFAIPESQRDAIAEGIEKVVLAVASSVANAKALDLLKQVIS